ncbi:MAG: 4'-phosphopantetheinyl transferase superfamily protein [Roseibium sp.]
MTELSFRSNSTRDKGSIDLQYHSPQVPSLTGKVDVFRARFASLPDVPRFLNETELTRAGHFKRESDAVRFRIGRAWLRRRIGAELGIAPSDVPLVYGPQGKPRLPGTPIHFNLTHTKDDIWLAIADTPVGLDLELPPVYDSCPLFKQIATFEEWGQTNIDGLTTERFLAIWTAKEAVLKMLGTGLMTDPRTISLGPLIAYKQMVMKIAGQWVCLQRLPAFDDGVAHIAAMGNSLDIKLHGNDRSAVF